MKFFGFLVSFTLAVLATVNADSTTVAFDTVYDSSSQSTLTIACSDGTNGLYTKGYTTLGSIPTFPYIGAAFSISGWNSASCGKCYQLTWGGNTITITALDVATGGFVLSETAMDVLTGGLAVELGRTTADWVEVDASACGL